jgi:nucleotide-binding universal stress UspA family protein
VDTVVVCGIDDIKDAGRIVRFAAGLTRRSGGRLVLLHVQPQPLIELQPQVAYAAPQPRRASVQLSAARELAQLAADAGVASSAEVRVGFGDLERRLLATARAEQATVLVVGSRAARLVSRASCPVVVIPATVATASTAADWGRERMASRREPDDAVPMKKKTTNSILCGVDGSMEARLALRHAAQLSDLLGVRLVVAHVVQPTPLGVGPTARQLASIPFDDLLAGGEAMLDQILEAEELGGVERRVVLGFPGDRLADLADDEGAELIVVGSRGRGVLKAALLGSVSTNVIAVARQPVLVVPPRTETPTRGASLAVAA